MPGIGIDALTNPAVRADAVREVAKAREQDPAHLKLRKATRQMESYFVGMLLKKMRPEAQKGGLFGEGSASATYRDMFDDSVAAEIGKRGSFGIADTLYREMSAHLESAKDE